MLVGLDIPQLRKFVIEPTLKSVQLWSQSSEILITGTGMIESRFEYVRQIGGGPAVSLFEIEPATYDDLALRVQYKPELYARVCITLRMNSLPKDSDFLMGNLTAAVIFARLKYYLHPDKLPKADDWVGMANYYKKIYNTSEGDANIKTSSDIFKSIIKGVPYHG